MSYKEIEKAIGYRFRKKIWLDMALTHPSYRHENISESKDNQRLEFVGDAVLGILTADKLFHLYPTATEGKLSKIRSWITKDDTLAEIGFSINLGEFLKLGKGELLNGGKKRKSNMADAIEAIIGAAWQDGGRKAVEKIFNTLFLPLINDSNYEKSNSNPKGTLQEYLQQKNKNPPIYSTIEISGPDHSPTHTVEVLVMNQSYKATANSKREAEQEAARKALSNLNIQD